MDSNFRPQLIRFPVWWEATPDPNKKRYDSREPIQTEAGLNLQTETADTFEVE